jgi:hypothetical protein
MLAAAPKLASAADFSICSGMRLRSSTCTSNIPPEDADLTMTARLGLNRPCASCSRRLLSSPPTEEYASTKFAATTAATEKTHAFFHLRFVSPKHGCAPPDTTRYASRVSTGIVRLYDLFVHRARHVCVISSTIYDRKPIVC